MKTIPAERLDKEKVLRAAAEIADRDGLDGLSLTTLAAALGIRTPSLYTHIASFGDLRRLIGLRGLSELNDRITEPRSGSHQGMRGEPSPGPIGNLPMNIKVYMPLPYRRLRRATSNGGRLRKESWKPSALH